MASFNTHLSKPQIITALNNGLHCVSETELTRELAKKVGVFSATGDSTDRAAAIVSELTSKGFVFLGKGDFYVTGIDMPAGTTIIGCGNSTRIILKDSVTSGYAVKLASNCIIQDITIDGGTCTPSSTLGTRNGVVWIGTNSSATSPVNSRIISCNILNFTGSGIHCYETSQGTTNHVMAVACYIDNCSCGIRTFKSEFNKFTSCRINGCYYGALNDGGNNTFTACDFSKSTVGFTIDNTAGVSNANNGHGGCIGCTFNHMGADNQGVGVYIRKTGHGFLFTGCQFFFCWIDIADAAGVVFSACLFGDNTSDSTPKYTKITVKQPTSGFVNARTIFSDCTFRNMPITDVSKNTIFENCCIRSGTGGMIESKKVDRNLVEIADDSFTGKYKHYNVTLPAGTYYLYFGTLTTDDTNADTSSGGFVDSNGYYVSNGGSVTQIERGSGKFTKFVLTAECDRLRLIPSDTQVHSEGDTLSFTDLMILTELDYTASQQYTPYCPSQQDMYDMIKAIQGGAS